MMHNKLGLLEVSNNELIDDLLTLLLDNKLDYTQSFIDLTQVLDQDDLSVSAIDSEWVEKWLSKIKQGDRVASLELMQQSNPVVIPRNHHVERVLEECKASGNNLSALNYLNVLLSPYQEITETHDYNDLPIDRDVSYQTFCGT